MNHNTEQVNAWWTAIVAEQLHAAGCRQIVICPGNRDLPLIQGFAQDPRLQLRSHLDERSAAFRALGLCKASARPCAVVTTSGSAVANCLPALCEAHSQGLPLTVISADRPPHLQNCGAPQTMPQAGIFATFCAAAADCPLPSWEGGGDLAIQLTRCLQRGLSQPGPIHLNLPYGEPLISTSPSHSLPPLPTLPCVTDPAAPLYDDQALSTACQHLRQARHGVVVLGPDNPLSLTQLQAFAAAGWPIIADASGPWRWAGLSTLISSADLLCQRLAPALAVDCIVRCGPAPIARPLWEWLQASQCPVIRIDRQPITRDFCHPHFTFLAANHPHLETAFSAAMATQASEWTAAWRAADRCAAAAVDRWLDHSQHFNEVKAAALACRIQHRPGHLHSANSLCVRHANLFCSPRHPWQQAWVNRGVNGIDGTLGLALGFSEQLGPLRLLCGDLAFIHDSAALPAIAAAGVDLQMVIVNNGGGRIFDTLASAPRAASSGRDQEQKSTERDRQLITYLRTPQSVDFMTLAAAYGLRGERVSDYDSLTHLLKQPIQGPQVIEIVVEEQGPAADLAALRQAVHAADDGAFQPFTTP